MRIAVYGGSFNPPHVGHAMVAAWLRWVDLVDEVWLLPTFAHPFDKNDLAPFDRRCRLCEGLARAVGPWVRVETIERDLPAPSYTIDTLEALSVRTPHGRFRLVVGADVVPTSHLWKDWDRIEADFTPIVVGRQGYRSPEEGILFPGVSSTEIRARVGRGAPVEHLVPREVLREMTGLYR